MSDILESIQKKADPPVTSQDPSAPPSVPEPTLIVPPPSTIQDQGSTINDPTPPLAVPPPEPLPTPVVQPPAPTPAPPPAPPPAPVKPVLPPSPTASPPPAGGKQTMKQRSRLSMPALAALLLLLVTLPVAVYYVGQQKNLADQRSQARVPVPCKICVNKSCVPSNERNCSSSENECAGDAQCGAGTGGGVGLTGTRPPTQPPERTTTPLPGGTCPTGYVRDPGTRECRLVPTQQDCSVEGEVPVASRPCCAGLRRSTTGICTVTGAVCPGGGRAPDGDLCLCPNPPANCGSTNISRTPTPDGQCKYNSTTQRSEGCVGDTLCVNGACVPAPGNGKPAPCTPAQMCPAGDQVREPGGRGECVNGQICTYTNVECIYSGNNHCFVKTESDCQPCGGGDGGDNPRTAQCKDINIYKNGTIVTDYTTLKAGDSIVIAVKGQNATKAHVRINGGSWNETARRNDRGEFVVDYTLPAGTVTYTIESEIYGLDRRWH